MAELTVRFDLSFGSRSLRCVMASAMIMSAVTEVASESVTLTTYYPAPSGVYSQMITTGNTYLARDSNIASSLGQKVGIGTSAPALLFHELYTTAGGNGTNWAALIQSTSGGSTASAYFSHGGGYGAYIDEGAAGSAGTYALDVNQSGNPLLYVAGNGMVGVGMAPAGYNLDVNGTIRINGAGLYNVNGWQMLQGNAGDWLRINQSQSFPDGVAAYGPWAFGTSGISVGAWADEPAGYVVATANVQGADLVSTDNACSETNYNVDGFTPCPGGQYATLVSGVITDLQLVPLFMQPPGGTAGGVGVMYCCNCPAGVCPNLP